MLEFKDKCVIGIDLAGLGRNPTGWVLLKDKTAKTRLLNTDSKILENTVRNHPTLIAIDTPLSLPKKADFFRKTDKD